MCLVFNGQNHPLKNPLSFGPLESYVFLFFSLNHLPTFKGQDRFSVSKKFLNLAIPLLCISLWQMFFGTKEELPLDMGMYSLV